MKFRFIGKGDNSPAKILFMGTERFTLGEVTDVQDGHCIAKLKVNQCFEAVTDDELVTEIPTTEVLEIPALKPGKKANALFTPASDDSE